VKHHHLNAAGLYYLTKNQAEGTLVYVGGRFVLGFGNSLAQMASPLLLTEICHPQHRGKVTAVYNCLWNLGALCKSLLLDLYTFFANCRLVVAWIAWATATIPTSWSWRTLALLQVVPAVIQIVFIYCKTSCPAIELSLFDFAWTLTFAFRGTRVPALACLQGKI
jgi:hypothetical protein